jgi:outer membrane protein assembly factor BamB
VRACSLLFSLCFVLAPASAGDWPHWRGPTRDGVTKEPSHFAAGKAWLPGAPAWTAKIGIGNSGPLAFKGRVYVTGWADPEDAVRCLDLKTGKELWARKTACPKYGRYHVGDEPFYGGPSATPEIDTETGLLYTLSADGDLRCWNIDKDGEPVWSVNFYTAFGVKQRPKLTPIYHRDYGYTTAPLVYGSWVIAEIGSTAKGTVVAFDKKTGKQAWTSELKDEAGHSGGLAPITVEGVACLACFTQRNVAIIRLDAGNEGKTVAKSAWITEGDCNIPTPTVVGNSVLVTSGYNRNAITRFDVTLKGFTEVWTREQSSKVCSPVVHDGSVYYSWKKVHCLDWKTGEPRWEGGAFGEAGSCAITSDGRLLVYGGQGKLALIESAARSPKAYTELAAKDRLFRTYAWPHVALADGRALCRDKDGNLSCFALAPGSEK